MIKTPEYTRKLKALIENGGAFAALFDRALIQRSEAFQLIDSLIDSIPTELEMAVKLLEQRDKMLQDARHQAIQIVEDARVQAGEIKDDAVRKAERMVDADVITRRARKEEERILAETDKYVRQQLFKLREELARILSEVDAGIETVIDPAEKHRSPQNQRYRTSEDSSNPLDMD